tara:strand:- start:4347 stop:5102 length:756 start_codon:yes stop_codon:yes gene_type:complete
MYKFFLLAVLCFAGPSVCYANSAMSKSEVSAKLISLVPNMNLEVKSIEDSPLKDFYQVITNKGILYVQRNGEFILSGSILAATPGLPNLTSLRQKLINQELISELEDEFITYRAPEQKHEILVFYDITCSYCQKLHQQVGEFNDLGITVHYAAYPRSGLFDKRNNQITTAHQQLQAIWCAEDSQKNQAFDDVFRGKTLRPNMCSNSVAEQYELGQQLKINGTPAVFSLDSTLVSRGYIPPQQLLAKLESKS